MTIDPNATPGVHADTQLASDYLMRCLPRLRIESTTDISGMRLSGKVRLGDILDTSEALRHVSEWLAARQEEIWVEMRRLKYAVQRYDHSKAVADEAAGDANDVIDLGDCHE